MHATITISTTFSSDQANRNKLNSIQPPAPQSCQTLARMSSANQAMTFKNEVVSDDDIDRYNLPFPKGGGRWWTRDAERDYYLWGGLTGNLAYEDKQEGWFYLYLDSVIYDIYIEPGDRTKDLKTGETIFHWNKILDINPRPKREDNRKITEILKEALSCFGFDGRKSIYFPRFRVSFDF